MEKLKYHFLLFNTTAFSETVRLRARGVYIYLNKGCFVGINFTDATTFSITAFGIMTFSIVTFSVSTFSFNIQHDTQCLY